ncbi:hypothetical protein WJX72_005908 [[Myrmecia] bisecta]|uniref:Solute carrier family 66 member 3 n=1 Tax=[Myrmecia] bisecta TaxID=41462 RepID=A0AAW1Q0D7_9CHLO
MSQHILLRQPGRACQLAITGKARCQHGGWQHQGCLLVQRPSTGAGSIWRSPAVLWSAAQVPAQLCNRQRQPFLPRPLKQASRHRPRQCRVVTQAIAPAFQLAAADGSTLVATLLGYGVLLGACIRSVPQIARIIQNESAEGLSLTANISELVAYTIIVAYNSSLGYPFSSYGEVAACWIQDVILVWLIVKYQRLLDWKIWAGTAAFAAFMWYLASGMCDAQALSWLQFSTIPMIALGGRVPQIVMNWQNGGSGELSMSTCLLNVMGCITRCWTTMVLTQDMLLLWACAIQGVLNAVLLYQTVMTALAKHDHEKLAQTAT